MPPVPAPRFEPAYAAAALFVDRALARNASLFASKRRAWAPDVLDDLCRRLADPGGAAGTSFDQRWTRQLDGASPETVHLAAELLYVHVVFATDLRAATKRRLVGETLARSPSAPALPPVLDAALEGGIAGTGVAYKARRQSQLQLLADAARAWKRLPAAQRRGLLTQPRHFKAWLFSVPHRGAYAQREALLHLVHPAAFEPIVSPRVKERIVAAFSRDVPAGVDDVDDALAAIRAALERRHGAAFRFDDPGVAARWRPQ